MTKSDEAKIRREGFQLNSDESEALLDFINLYDKKHMCIEPEIVVKLELLSNRYYIENVRTKPHANSH